MAAPVLVDTSPWVAALRAPDSSDSETLEQLLQAKRVACCGPVAAELLAGTRPPQRAQLRTVLEALPWADLDRSAWMLVGEVAGELRSTGTTVALTDIEIAVAASTSGAALWSYDSDFVGVEAALPALERFLP